MKQFKTIRSISLPVIALLLSTLYWFVDAAINTFIFESNTFYLESLLRPESVELWTRSQVITMLMTFSVIAMSLLHRQRYITAQLNKYKNELQDTVHSRTNDLHTKNTMLENEIMERLKIEAELIHLATIDPLTQIHNRRKFNDALYYELNRDYRNNNGLSLIMCDLDHFKLVNDEHGHNVGDEALKEFTQLVSSNIRNTDIFARWGGEEFVILLPDTRLNVAIKLAEKLCALTARHNFPFVGNITASFGVTQHFNGDSETSFLNHADSALYNAKRNGRNRVEVVAASKKSVHLFNETRALKQKAYC